MIGAVMDKKGLKGIHLKDFVFPMSTVHKIIIFVFYKRMFTVFGNELSKNYKCLITIALYSFLGK
jgi:hypothetical protein